VAPPGNQAVKGGNKHQPVYRKKPVYSTPRLCPSHPQGATDRNRNDIPKELMEKVTSDWEGQIEIK
jgi:hypothetical protein